MKTSYIVSYDLGTSGVKIALVDLEGNLIGSETVGYSLLIPQHGWAEQDPDEFWEAVCQGTRQVVAHKKIHPRDVSGIAFGTQWKGIIPIDADGKVLHNAIIWLDGRARKQADTLNARLKTDTFTERDYWARLLWVKEERLEIFQKTDCFLEVNAFLKFKATGEKAADLTNDFIHHLDSSIQDDYSRVLAAAELDLDKLPPLSNDARMVFFNINNIHDRRHMLGAVREGICFSLRWKLEMYRAQTGKIIDAIRVVGGAAASDRWMQTLSNILKIPVIIPANARHAGAIGTAYCAIVGLGVCKNFDAADRMIKKKNTFYPDAACEALYDTLYGVFKDLYPSTRQMFATLNQLH